MSTTAKGLHHLLATNSRGRVTIRGTKLWVQRIVGLHQEGLTPEEIAAGFDDVPLSAVYAALSHYYEHKQAMDAENERDHAEAVQIARELGAEIL